MAVFNTPFVLVKRAIDSVQAQDFKDFELIIVDDGSENTLSGKILQYCEQLGINIIFIKHSNCGQSASINRAVKISSGKYISMIDSDDEYKPNHLSMCLAEMNGADLISSFTDTVVDKEEDYYVPNKDDNQQSIHVDECILFATLFGKREVFEKLAFQSTYAADAAFYERAAIEYNVKKVNLRTYIYYRNIENSLSATLKRAQVTAPATY